MLKTSAPDLKRGQGEAGEASIGHCADWAGMTEDRGQIPLLGSSSFCPQPQGTGVPGVPPAPAGVPQSSTFTHYRANPLISAQ